MKVVVPSKNTMLGQIKLEVLLVPSSSIVKSQVLIFGSKVPYRPDNAKEYTPAFLLLPPFVKSLIAYKIPSTCVL